MRRARTLASCQRERSQSLVWLVALDRETPGLGTSSSELRESQLEVFTAAYSLKRMVRNLGCVHAYFARAESAF